MSKTKMLKPGKYRLNFTQKQWDEILELIFPPFNVKQGDVLLRKQWVGIGHLALGKAQRIADGFYGGSEREENEWASELRQIANIIFEFFQPGDGKI